MSAAELKTGLSFSPLEIYVQLVHDDLGHAEELRLQNKEKGEEEESGDHRELRLQWLDFCHAMGSLYLSYMHRTLTETDPGGS
jgi:hypothetical protein